MQKETEDFIKKVQDEKEKRENEKRDEIRKTSAVLLPCPCCGELIYVKTKVSKA